MKKTISCFVLLSFVLFVQNSRAQNLFSNADFELFNNCPTDQAQVFECIGWDEVVQSADYMNCSYACWTSQQTNGAQSGSGYMGFATYGSNNASEAIGQFTTSSLVIGTDYTITFWAKKTSSGFYSNDCSGVSFYGFNGNPASGGSQAGVCMGAMGSGGTLLVVSPLVSNLEWQQFSVSFTSTGAFDYVGMCVECTNCAEYIFVDNFNFVSTINNFLFSNTCFGDSTFFQSPLVTGLDSVDWSFDDPSTGIQNFSSIQNPSHLFSSAGSFNVQLILYHSSGTNDTMTNAVTIYNHPIVNLGSDTTICNGQQFIIDAGNQGQTYLWNTGATTQTTSADTSGTYWVTVGSGNCIESDSIAVTIGSFFNLNIGNDTTYCSNFSRVLNGGNNFDAYLWSDGTTDQTILVNQTGTYWLQINNNCGNYSDTIHIFQLAPPNVNLGNDTSFCGNFSISFDASCIGCNYLWSNGETTNQVIINNPININVQVSNSCGVAADNVSILSETEPFISLPSDTEVCSFDGFLLTANTNLSNIIWSTGETSKTITIPQAGIYWAIVTGPCGVAIDSIKIIQCPGEYIMPNAFSPNADGHNDFLFPIKIGDATLLQFDVYNRWGQLVYVSSDGVTKWNGSYNNVACEIGVYAFIVQYKENVSGTIVTLKGNVTLLR